jgi:tetratricopeptide (TPR) repeat protein
MNATQTLQAAIKFQLTKSNLEVVGIQPIPSHTDKMVRLNTLEEMLEDLDGSEVSGSIGYLIQVKPKASAQAESEVELQAQESTEALYLPDGKPNAPYLMHNADLLFDAGDYGLARSIYSTVLQSSDNTGKVLGRIARCFEAEGKLEEARSNYEQAITYLPSVESYQHLAAILTRQSKDHEAAEVLERAIYLKDISNSLKFEIHKSCGNSWTRAQNLEQAEMNFKKALDIAPSSDDVRSNLGTLYLQTQRFDEAKRCFRDAIASNQNNYMALTGLGSCALAEGDKVAAHDYFSQSLKIEINNPAAIFYLVRCAFEIKSYARACHILEEYIQIVPVNSSLLYSLAGLRFHLGRFSESKDTVLKILELQPQHPGAKDLLTLIQKYAGIST